MRRAMNRLKMVNLKSPNVKVISIPFKDARLKLQVKVSFNAFPREIYTLIPILPRRIMRSQGSSVKRLRLEDSLVEKVEV